MARRATESPVEFLMRTCSCPHCGRTGISYRVQDAHAVFVCIRCRGAFSPLGSKALPECTTQSHPEESAGGDVAARATVTDPVRQDP